MAQRLREDVHRIPEKSQVMRQTLIDSEIFLDYCVPSS